MVYVCKIVWWLLKDTKAAVFAYHNVYMDVSLCNEMHETTFIKLFNSFFFSRSFFPWNVHRKKVWYAVDCTGYNGDNNLSQ